MSTSIIRQILVAALAAVTLCHTALGETIAVIGTGNVGGALGTRLGDLGHTIVSPRAV